MGFRFFTRPVVKLEDYHVHGASSGARRFITVLTEPLMDPEDSLTLFTRPLILPEDSLPYL